MAFATFLTPDKEIMSRFILHTKNSLLTVPSEACVPSPSFHLRYAMLVLWTCSVFGELPALYAWVSDNVTAPLQSSLASSLNIAFTGPGQIIGVWIHQDQQAARYQTGHL